MDETENYRNFLRLCDEIVKLNGKICDLRPVSEIEDSNEAEELKKKLQMHCISKLRKVLTVS